MVRLLALLAVLQADEPEWRFPTGQAACRRFPSVQRLAHSGRDFIAVTPRGDDLVCVKAEREGPGTLILWTKTTRRTIPLLAVPPSTGAIEMPVREQPAPASDVQVFELEQDLEAVTELVEADGGILVVGRSRSGGRVTLTLTPAPKDAGVKPRRR
jgi:hypothetical protein